MRVFPFSSVVKTAKVLFIFPLFSAVYPVKLPLISKCDRTSFSLAASLLFVVKLPFIRGEDSFHF